MLRWISRKKFNQPGKQMMANKDDFTPDEWTKVLESIVAAGVAIAAADPSGWLGTFKEATAGTPTLAKAKDDPRCNELIRSVVADFEKSNDGSILAMQEHFTEGNAAKNVQHSLEKLREVAAIVDAKAPNDALAFKKWLYEISERVAKAAKEGTILGFGGVRVSDAEKTTLHDISLALGIAA